MAGFALYRSDGTTPATGESFPDVDAGDVLTTSYVLANEGASSPAGREGVGGRSDGAAFGLAGHGRTRPGIVVDPGGLLIMGRGARLRGGSERWSVRRAGQRARIVRDGRAGWSAPLAQQWR